MAKFFIEVPHESGPVACARVVEIFLKSGSHFLTHADWGCMDGDHKAWIAGEFENREEAIAILPPSMRRDAKVVKLNDFTMDKIQAILRQHDVEKPQAA